MLGPAVTTYDPAGLLEMLKDQAFLHGYQLLLFRQDTGSSAEPDWQLCHGHQPLSGALPFIVFQEALEVAVMANRPTTLRSPEGLYVFAIPFVLDAQSRYCLIGTGARDTTLDLAGVESLAKLTHQDPVALLELLQKHPALPKDVVHAVAEKAASIIAMHTHDREKPGPCDEVFDKLAAVVGICEKVDKMPSTTAIMSLFLDTMHIVFDIPRLGIALSGNAPQQLFLTDPWEHGAVTKKIVSHRNHSLFPPIGTGKTFIVDGEEIATLFPESHTYQATCLMFWAKEDDCAVLVLLDTRLADGDAPLVELICSRVTSRLQQLIKEEQMLRANSQSQKMLELIGSILMVDNEDELYDSLLDSASGLVGALNGSFMVIDPTGENLRIEATKGLNAHLAKSFTVRVGEGIAGKVAAGAAPYLIRDVERDSRIGRGNRSRFKTKSFVSLPVSYKQRVVGVLNLADKENGSTFSERDLETLVAFTGHVSGLVYRASAGSGVKTSCRTALTDPVTGLYTQGFMVRRIQEELSRCKRQGRVAAVMRIDVTESGQAGDKAVKAVAEIVERMLREMDVVCRCGEMSLCVLLPETGRREAVLVGDRISTRLADALAEAVGPLARTAVGISTYPEDGRDANQLLAAAERSLARGGTPAFGGMISLPESLYGQVQRLPDCSNLATRIKLHDPRQLLPVFQDLPDTENRQDARPALPASSGSPAD